MVGRAGIGVDNVDVGAATARGIVVMNTPGGNTVTTAEHAIALLVALARHIPQATASMKSGKWDKKSFIGMELYNRTLGVIGLGNIGRIVAQRARGLGMKVVAYDPFLSADAAAKLEVELLDLDSLLARADALSIHVPRTPDTAGLLEPRGVREGEAGRAARERRARRDRRRSRAARGARVRGGRRRCARRVRGGAAAGRPPARRRTRA